MLSGHLRFGPNTSLNVITSISKATQPSVRITQEKVTQLTVSITKKKVTQFAVSITH